MSRLLKLVATVLALAAGGAVALAAGSAPAQSRSHMIICPLEPNDTITQPCCGPPIVTAAASSALVCCAAAQIACPIGMTLSSSSNPSTAGHKVTLTGRWPGGTAGHTVELWQESAGAKSFTKVAQTKTGSLGDFQFVRKGVQTNRKWYASVGSDRSLTIDQRVGAVVTLGVSGLRANGHVFPNHAGERLVFEQHTSKGWSVIARPRLNRDSTYSVGLPGHGEADFKAVFPGDRRNVRSSARLVASA